MNNFSAREAAGALATPLGGPFGLESGIGILQEFDAFVTQRVATQQHAAAEIIPGLAVKAIL
jgi:hypothetical protein